MWWPNKKSRYKLLPKRRGIQLLFIAVCILAALSFIYYLTAFTITNPLDKIHWERHGEKCCECTCGWRAHFVAGEEERRVFQSVRREHMHLLEKLKEASARLETANKMIPVREAELRELEMRIGELKLLRREYSDRRNVQLKLPHSPLERTSAEGETATSLLFDQLEECVDFSRCSISRPHFPVFLYPLSQNSSQLAVDFHNEFLRQHSAAIVSDAAVACIFVAILDNGQTVDQLPHFGPNGRNHLLLDLEGKLRQKSVAAAFLATPGIQSIRPSMDISVHLGVPNYDPNRWQFLPHLLPAMRKYFVRFVADRTQLTQRQLADLDALRKSMDASQDSYLIDLDCSLPNGSHLCHSPEQRLRTGSQSVFSILFPQLPAFQKQFYESLESGSIPVVCSLHQPLPFDDLIDWRLATVQIAPARFPELHFVLRSIPLADLLEMKRKGRFFFEQYLADKRVLTRAILSALRFRLQLPGAEQQEPSALPLYAHKNGASWDYPSFVSTATKPPYDDEYLGPIEVPLESAQYVHNFTAISLYSSSLWNVFPLAVDGAPRFLPNALSFPSDAEFGDDTSFGMRPVAPGSGREFSLALGGNRQREQFTIVIVTFNRESATLERLNNLPYLNRVVVVWNDVGRLPSVAAWPRLHVPVLFVNGTSNSLNNRFVPYREIETEAVLSMDDDIDLKHFEIIFAFRVWREQRDRIVGFPARYSARFGDENFYNSNHTCQYSMILTGAAFLHKFYLHAYTYHMPEIIRQKVDEWMNCEDLAMNFLVAHLTRKAPIKTTSKWTLRCPTCTEMLSSDQAHFAERHDCIRFFILVYGYNPLVQSQFRADSVLFKTRVPPEHQKCFRYV